MLITTLILYDLLMRYSQGSFIIIEYNVSVEILDLYTPIMLVLQKQY